MLVHFCIFLACYIFYLQGLEDPMYSSRGPIVGNRNFGRALVSWRSWMGLSAALVMEPPIFVYLRLSFWPLDFS